MTKKGMKEARGILLHVNLEGVDMLLKQREYHEEYINYQSELETVREQQQQE